MEKVRPIFRIVIALLFIPKLVKACATPGAPGQSYSAIVGAGTQTATNIVATLFLYGQPCNPTVVTLVECADPDCLTPLQSQVTTAVSMPNPLDLQYVAGTTYFESYWQLQVTFEDGLSDPALLTSPAFSVNVWEQCKQWGLVEGTKPTLTFDVAPGLTQTLLVDLRPVWPRVRCHPSICKMLASINTIYEAPPVVSTSYLGNYTVALTFDISAPVSTALMVLQCTVGPDYFEVKKVPTTVAVNCSAQWTYQLTKSSYSFIATDGFTNATTGRIEIGAPRMLDTALATYPDAVLCDPTLHKTTGCSALILQSATDICNAELLEDPSMVYTTHHTGTQGAASYTDIFINTNTARIFYFCLMCSFDLNGLPSEVPSFSSTYTVDVTPRGNCHDFITVNMAAGYSCNLPYNYADSLTTPRCFVGSATIVSTDPKNCPIGNSYPLDATTLQTLDTMYYKTDADGSLWVDQAPIQTTQMVKIKVYTTASWVFTPEIQVNIVGCSTDYNFISTMQTSFIVESNVATTLFTADTAFMVYTNNLGAHCYDTKNRQYGLTWVSGSDLVLLDMIPIDPTTGLLQVQATGPTTSVGHYNLIVSNLVDGTSSTQPISVYVTPCLVSMISAMTVTTDQIDPAVRKSFKFTSQSVKTGSPAECMPLIFSVYTNSTLLEVSSNLTVRASGTFLYLDLDPKLLADNSTTIATLKASFQNAPNFFVQTDVSLSVLVPYVPPGILPAEVNAPPFFETELAIVNASNSATIDYSFPRAIDIQADNMTITLSNTSIGSVIKLTDEKVDGLRRTQFKLSQLRMPSINQTVLVTLRDDRGLSKTYQLQFVHDWVPGEIVPVQNTTTNNNASNVFAEILKSPQNLKKFPALDPKIVKFENVSADELKEMHAKLNLTSEGRLTVSMAPYRLFISEEFQKIFDTGKQVSSSRQLAANASVNDLIKISILSQDVQSESNLDSNITFQEWTDAGPVFNVKFKDASSVSVGEFDYLKVKLEDKFIKKAFLVIDEKGRPVDMDEVSTTGKLQAQTPVPLQKTNDTDLQKTAEAQETLRDAVMSSIIGLGGTNFLLSMAMAQVWAMVNSLQIIAHYIVLNVTLPDCTKQVMDWILAVVSFELMPEALADAMRAATFGELDDDERSFSPNMEDVGMDNIHIVINMFNPMFFTCIYLLQCIFYLIMKRIACCDCLKEKSEEHVNDIPGELIRLGLETTLDITLCALIELTTRPNNSGMARASYFTALALFLLIIYLLLLGYRIVKYHKDKIDDEEGNEEFHQTYGALWEDLAVSITRLPWFNVVFMLRRLVYAIVLVLPQANDNCPQIAQFILVIIINICMTAFIAKNRPFEAHDMNRMEFFNEYCILFGSVIFLAMKRETDGDQLYRLGLFFNGLVLFMSIVNFLYVLACTVSEWCTWCRRKKARENAEIAQREQEWMVANEIEQLAKQTMIHSQSAHKLLSHDDMDSQLPDKENVSFEDAEGKIEHKAEGIEAIDFNASDEKHFEAMMSARQKQEQMKKQIASQKEDLKKTFSKMSQLKDSNFMNKSSAERQKIIAEVLDRKKKERAKARDAQQKKIEAKVMATINEDENESMNETTKIPRENFNQHIE